MRWTKLRHIVEERVTPSLKGRVRLESTHYRKAHDQEGRVGIVIDREQIWGIGCIEGDLAKLEVARDLGRIQDLNSVADEIVRRLGRHNQYQFHRSVWDFTQMSIEDALGSEDAVIRGLAFLDARTGKRRIRELALRRPDTEVERACLGARLKADGLACPWRVD